MQSCIGNICCANIFTTQLEQYYVTLNALLLVTALSQICLDPEVLHVMLSFKNDVIGESLQEQVQNRYFVRNF